MTRWLEPFEQCQGCGLRGICIEFCTLGFHIRRARQNAASKDSFSYCDAAAVQKTLGDMLAGVATWTLGEFTENLGLEHSYPQSGVGLLPNLQNAAEIAWHLFHENLKHIVPLNFLPLKENPDVQA